MSVPNFMRFRRKRLEKQTHIDNFSLKKKSKTNLFGFTFIAEKKIAKNIYNFFFVNQNCKAKKFTISKICNKKFRKHQIQKKFAKIL